MLKTRWVSLIAGVIINMVLFEVKVIINNKLDKKYVNKRRKLAQLTKNEKNSGRKRADGKCSMNL